MIAITAARVRSVVNGLYTEKDAAEALRRHRIKYNYSTRSGFLHIVVPCRAGSIMIYRSAAGSAPLVIRSAPPVSVPESFRFKSFRSRSREY